MNYDVTIRAIITKTIRVSASNESEAAELANSEFTTETEDQENYEQDTLSIEVVK